MIVIFFLLTSNTVLLVALVYFSSPIYTTLTVSLPALNPPTFKVSEVLLDVNTLSPTYTVYVPLISSGIVTLIVAFWSTVILLTSIFIVGLTLDTVKSVLL